MAILSARRVLFPVLAAALVLAGCSGAFVDRRREAGTLKHVGNSLPGRPVVCYNGWTSTPEQVRDLATRACADAGKVAVPVRQKAGTCPLFYPVAAEFKCVSREEAVLAGPRRQP